MLKVNKHAVTTTFSNITLFTHWFSSTKPLLPAILFELPTHLMIMRLPYLSLVATAIRYWANYGPIYEPQGREAINLTIDIYSIFHTMPVA